VSGGYTTSTGLRLGRPDPGPGGPAGQPDPCRCHRRRRAGQ